MIRSERISDELVGVQENNFLAEGILDAKSFQKLEKMGFMIFFAGGIHDQLKRKLTRICDIFSVEVHDLPQSAQHFETQRSQIVAEIQSINSVLRTTKIELFNNYSFFSEIRKPEAVQADSE